MAGDRRFESVDAALADAAAHARAAASESLAALAALAEAGAIATGDDARVGVLAGLAAGLERAREWLGDAADRDAAATLEALQRALDDEIHRWEERSRDEVEARSVLRAFLAVREVLWEIASRRPASPPPETPPPSADEEAGEPVALRKAPRRARRVRVQG